MFKQISNSLLIIFFSKSIFLILTLDIIWLLKLIFISNIEGIIKLLFGLKLERDGAYINKVLS